jgi:mRNA interferase RelE/StbE
MDWQVQIERKAQKTLDKIPNPYKSNIIETINDLADQPRPHNCKKLKGFAGLWRVRVGSYRVVYQIHDDKYIILIVRIGHRSDVYEGL